MENAACDAHVNFGKRHDGNVGRKDSHGTVVENFFCRGNPLLRVAGLHNHL